MRSLRWLGLIAFSLFVVAAFTPLANLLNVRMAGVADEAHMHLPAGRLQMKRGLETVAAVVAGTGDDPHA